MNTIVTQYKEADQEAVKQLVLTGLKAFGFSYHPVWDKDLDNPKAFYIDTGGMFFVLKTGNDLAGTVALINKGDSAELKRLYVKKEYQEKGFGSALLDKVIAWAKEHRFTKMEFETNKKFTKAHLLYQKRGFKVVREDTESYYMEKEL